MKGKKNYVQFELIIDDEKIPAKVYAEELRNILNDNSEELKKGIQNIEITFQVGEKSFNVPFKVEQLRRMIKRAELTTDIIPRPLRKYMKDITQTYANKPSASTKGRNHEIEKAWFYISQKKRNNVFLVGEKDVGKTRIALEIIRQIATNECPKEFYDKRVVKLDPELMLRIEKDYYYKYVVNQLVKFLYKNKDKILLYIDKSIFMKTDVSLIEILNLCIKNYNIPIITTSEEEDFDKYFLDDPIISKYLNYIYVEEPELEEIQPMIKNRIWKLQKEHGIKISEEMIKFGIFTSILTNSVSANPGNVINVFEKAFLEAKRKDKEEVDKKCILSCYNSYLKLYNNTSKEEKKMIAYHEVGHYIVTTMCEHVKDEKIAFVSILPMMDFLGVNWPYRILGKTLNYTKDYFLDHIAIYMGGRIAEKLVTFKDSTGASSDLAAANSLAESMITIYGLAETDTNKNRSYATENHMLKTYLISETKKEEFDKEIQNYVDEGYKRAEKIIKANVELIEVIVEQLLKEEILTGEQLTQICNDFKKSKDDIAVTGI